MRIFILGAGKIGRGFLAHLAAGWAVTFVDRSAGLVEELRRRGAYTIHLASADGSVRKAAVAGFTALHVSQAPEVAQAVLEADLLAAAVPPADLDGAADLLASALERVLPARPEGLNLVLCVNLPGAAGLLRSRLEARLGRGGLSRLGVADSIVIRSIPEPPPALREGNPLDLLASDYPELYVDRDAVVGTFPPLPGVVLQDRFHERELRKLYTYNLIHALLGFWGQARGHVTLADCVRDPGIRRQAQQALEEATAGLRGEFGFGREDMEAWNAGVWRLMENPHLGDRVERLVRDPLRKLGRGERLTGPALLALKHGREPAALTRTIALALRSLGIGAEGIDEACGLEAEEEGLRRRIREALPPALPPA